MSQLGKKEIFTIALGSVIGWGAFVLPGNVFLPNYGVINTLIGFIIAIGMLYFIEKSYAVVMQKVPKSGGEYSFAREILGHRFGFMTGWGLLLAYVSIIPLNATAVPMVLDSVLPFYDKGVLLYSVAEYPVYSNDIIVSLAIILVFAIINILGITGALRAQNMLVFALISSLVAIGLLTIIGIDTPQLANFDSNWGSFDTASIIRIIAFAPWAFIGFDAVAQLAGDHKMPSKQVSRMTLIAIVMGALVYNGLNAITALGISADKLSQSPWATGEAVRFLVGDVMFYLLAVGMFGAVVSGLNGFFISSSRLVMSMAHDYHIGNPEQFRTPIQTGEAGTLLNSTQTLSDVNATTDTTDNKHQPQKHKPKKIKLLPKRTKAGTLKIPKWVMYFITLCAMVVPFFGRTALLWFVDLASVGASLAYFMTCWCAFKLADSGGSKFIASMGMAVSVAFLVFLLTPLFDANISMPSYFSLLFWTLLGVVVYTVANKRLADKSKIG